MNTTVHPSEFSVLRSCSLSAFGSGFDVRCSEFSIRTTERGTQKRELNIETEHERRTEKAEP